MRIISWLSFFVLTIFLYEASVWAQPLPASDDQPRETIHNNQESTRQSAGKDEGKQEGEQTEEEPGIVRDPLQPYNRLIFTANDKLYVYLLKPAAKGYRVVLPETVPVSIRKFYTNIRMPSRFANSLLQGKFKGAGTEILRFVINSTVGVAGFFDPAKSYFSLEKQDEDFGQTLGLYMV